MALGTPAWAAGSATIPTRVLRHLPAALTGVPVISHANSATATTRGGGYGVAAGGDLAVTTTGALGYSVAVGHFSLPGTSATGQGTYVGYNDAAVTGTLPARNATNPYIAYICVQIRDTDEDATGSEDATIVVIQGTPAATPAAPAVPSSLGSLLVLSEVLVPSAANGGPVVFTERRFYLNAIGGIQRCTSTTRPTSSALWAGIEIYETDTKAFLWYDGTSWRYAYKPPATYTPTTNTVAGNGGADGNAVMSFEYDIIDNICNVRGVYTLGNTTTWTTTQWLMTFSLPPGLTPATTASRRIGPGALIDQSALALYNATAEAQTTGIVVYYSSGSGAGYNIANNIPFAWTSTDMIWFNVSYPVA